mmetsp:Transcript_34801/g.107708  ORF Transcript_34801/g.107708 Transcript_34801/m.107708 type:complete len:224 (-) Transcript_34801:642-1313(-)
MLWSATTVRATYPAWASASSPRTSTRSGCMFLSDLTRAATVPFQRARERSTGRVLRTISFSITLPTWRLFYPRSRTHPRSRTLPIQTKEPTRERRPTTSMMNYWKQRARRSWRSSGAKSNLGMVPGHVICRSSRRAKGGGTAACATWTRQRANADFLFSASSEGRRNGLLPSSTKRSRSATGRRITTQSTLRSRPRSTAQPSLRRPKSSTPTPSASPRRIRTR